MITVSYRQIPTQYYIPAFTVLLTVFSNEIIKASDFSMVKFGYLISDMRLPYRNIRRYRAEALVVTQFPRFGNETGFFSRVVQKTQNLSPLPFPISSNFMSFILCLSFLLFCRSFLLKSNEIYLLSKHGYVMFGNRQCVFYRALTAADA